MAEKPQVKSPTVPKTRSASPSDPALDAQVDKLIAEVEAGAEVEIVGPAHRDLASTFTEDNIVRFLAGEITMAELYGMTMEEAYGLATFGYKFYQEGNFHKALKVFEGLVTSNPYDAYFRTMLGAVYQELDMNDAALIEYNTAIELDEAALHAYLNRANLLIERGQLELALNDIEKAVSLDPNNKDPATLRARALAQAMAQAFSEAQKIIAAATAKSNAAKK